MSALTKTLITRSAIAGLLGQLPFVQELYARAVWKRKMNQFLGVYGSVEEAAATAVRLKALGWNEPGIAAVLVADGAPDLFADRSQLFQPCHYAAMFWISKRIGAGRQLVDLGGAGGISYELYTRYAELPPGARWHVVDFPELIQRGERRHAAARDILTFGSSLAAAPRCDILHTAGCLQYMKDPFGLATGSGILEEMTALPAHIIVNKLPLTDGASFVTLQNLLNSAVPYTVFNRDQVLSYFRRHGYRLADEWRVPELSVGIAFHPRHHVAEPRGLSLTRDDV
jgi:putative methyltransferase (TIGR04325 family)